jgi:thiol:disulfide interchange protein
MPSPASDNGLGDAVRSVSEHAAALGRLEVRLAKEEVREKLASLGQAAVLALVGVVLALFGIGFALAAAAAGLDEILPMWLSLLIVGVALFVVAGLLSVLARRSARRGQPPVPKQAIDEAKATKQALQEQRAAG